jgi:DNA repair photolyase
LFDGRALLDALVVHPAFIPHRTVISVATSSSEPFLRQTHNQTWKIINRLADLGLRNPVWFVTKLGFPADIWPKWRERLAETLSAGIPVVVSITYAALPKGIEPYHGDRFKHANLLRELGVRVSHHLRPVLRGVNDTRESARAAVQTSTGKVDVLCVGGLRPDPGLRLAWEHIHKQPAGVIPKTTGKDLTEEFPAYVREAAAALRQSTPVVERSSEALAYLLDIPEFNLYRYRPGDESDEVLIRLPCEIARRLAACAIDVACLVRNAAAQIGLHLERVEVDGPDVRVEPLAYQTRTALIHALGHSGVLP